MVGKKQVIQEHFAFSWKGVFEEEEEEVVVVLVLVVELGIFLPHLQVRKNSTDHWNRY